MTFGTGTIPSGTIRAHQVTKRQLAQFEQQELAIGDQQLTRNDRTGAKRIPPTGSRNPGRSGRS
jgi:hypothetical protein